MRIMLLLLSLLLSVPCFAADREVHPDTGTPIYNEDEPKPANTPYHIRKKDGTFKLSMDESSRAAVVEVSVVKDSKEAKSERSTIDPKTCKGYVSTDSDGTPVFKDGSFPPVGISYRIYATPCESCAAMKRGFSGAVFKCGPSGCKKQ